MKGFKKERECVRVKESLPPPKIIISIYLYYFIILLIGPNLFNPNLKLNLRGPSDPTCYYKNESVFAPLRSDAVEMPTSPSSIIPGSDGRDTWCRSPNDLKILL